MASLASLLARDAIVSLDTIEQALQRQVLEGGELDTALLELSQVPENVLASYRAASFELPVAARADLASVDPVLRARVSAEAARRHRVVPLRVAGDTLVLASAWPLAEADARRLEEHVRGRVALRITTELRLSDALARYYGVELGSRMRLLCERLERIAPGEACEVQPLMPASGRPPASTSSSSSSIPPAPTANDVEPSRHSSFPPERGAGTAVVPPNAVRVIPVVRLGSNWPASHSEDEPEEAKTRPSRPRAPASRPVSSRPPRRISGSPRGPLTRAQAIELLGQAHDRDRVLDVFFSFARQYFECTVLFAVRDERLLGLDASGLPSLTELLAVEVPIGAGAVQGVVGTRSARVVRLEPSVPAGALAAAIGRGDAQPCALIPVVIRQRVVSLLYGDRAGEPIALAELSELLETLPAVSTAFERIIQERKVEAMKARRAQAGRAKAFGAGASAEAAAPEGTFRRSGAAASPRSTAAGVAPRQANPAAPAASDEGSAPAAAPTPAAAPAAAPPDDDIAERPTMQLPTEAINKGLLRRASERPPAPGPTLDIPLLHPRKRKEQDITRPERPSRLSGSRAAGAARSVDPPSPRTLSQPPAGTGSYAVYDSPGEVVDARSQQRPRTPARSGDKGDAAPSSARGRSDPRREDGDAAATQEDVVSIPAAVRDSLLPPRPAPDAPAESPAVDASAEAERLVDELCRSGPDDGRPQLDALLRLGDAALSVLERRFPGPLWFDRHKPRTRMPAGRDISAIARALFEFEARALPHIAALLAAPQTEVRLCATMLAADRVGPELLWPIYQRLFDPDGQVRLTAIESLPLFRNAAGFDEVLKSLRQKAAGESEAIPNRLAALEAISVLRDAGSIDLLADLGAHGNRQLSVPAHRALIAITGQDFGGVPRKWKAWIDKNRYRHRVEWLIEGLMHTEERVRTTAGMELQKLTQVYYGYAASAPKRDRERAQKRYKDWWDSQGRTQFGG